MALEPFLEELLASERARGLPAPRGIAELRERVLDTNTRRTALYMDDEPVADFTEHTVPVQGFPDVRVRIYRPEDDETLPALITFFGGAFRLGGIEYPAYVNLYSRRARDARIAVVAVDYALGPEHKYPAAVEQAHAALEWLVREAERLRIDPGRLAVGGQSAGGNIAAVLCLMNRDRANHPIRKQILEVPALDLTGRYFDRGPGRVLKVNGYLAKFGLNRQLGDYLPSPRHQAAEPYASPLLADDLSGLPEAHIFTAEYDFLRRGGAAYAGRLSAADVPATCVQYAGQTHESSGFTRVLHAARQWQREIVAILRELHD